jgi:3-oxoacyl-[acyl-carrier protein] reductase
MKEMDVLTLRNRTAIVTGGTRGIGYEIARKFLSAGMNVAIIGTNEKGVKEAAETLQGQGAACKGYVCDVSSVGEIKTTLKTIGEDFLSIDVLVNNAGILDVSKIGTLSEEEWDKVLDVNLKGTYFFTQEAVPYLEKSKHPRIINIGSNAGRMGGFENGLAYTASKGGVVALTYGAARRLAPKKITVNCVAPGTIETEMSKDNYDEEAHKRLLARFPLGRLGRPEEVAAAVCYFASEESGFTTGAVLDVNGGMFMG